MRKISSISIRVITTFFMSAIGIQTAIAQHGYAVEHFGQLRSIMQEANISAQVDLQKFSGNDSFYALGAFENLKGEILIFGGESYSTRSIDDQVEFVNAFEERATLLVASHVDSWQEFIISETNLNYQDLEKIVEGKAVEYGIDTNQPFPFLLEGVFGEMDWHVIDWPEGDKHHTHEKHKTAGPHGTLVDSNVRILGFWSDSHHGIFTHHATNMHLHFVTQDAELAGHVDSLNNGNELILYLPLIE